MANILKRFADIMAANVNALLDKAENPEKMIDQYLREIAEDLSKVKDETASVMAAETRAKRELDACVKEVEDLQKYAEKALLAGNEGDARKFLEQKAQMAQKQSSLQQAYDLAAANSRKMREMHDKLVKDMESLQQRRETIRAKVAVAKTQERINDISTNMTGAGEAMAAFDRMEAKADRMLDEANAKAELNAPGETVEDLKEKYAVSSTEVDDELAALKAKLGV